ncbi:MAG: WecB/TagA/CpsF family glycosyltransferase [Patescibacteria group bacterium]|jgi:N-acetylglucosaminyldiphosphoundecaprenol N-acetyl-beta-D-mannosaminyltransferase
MKIDILGIKINAITQNQVLDQVESFFIPNGQTLVSSHQLITANPEIILESLKHHNYQNLINQSSLVLADGIGLLWAAKFLSLKSNNLFFAVIQAFVAGASLLLYPDYVKTIIPQRITGVDLMEKICELASSSRAQSRDELAGQKNLKVYLLGGEHGIAKQCADKLKEKYFNLKIVGAETGPTIHGSHYTIEKNLIDNIINSKADILFVAMGAPKQDFFIQQILPQLPQVKLAMGVGGAFDFISGKAKRAPLIYQDLGIEWLFRLINEPWRFLRILNATIRFMWNVIKFNQISNQ